MKTRYNVSLQKISALLLAILVLFASYPLQGFAKKAQTDSTTSLGASALSPSPSENNDTDTQHSPLTSLGFSGLRAVNEIILPAFYNITFYEEYEGVANVYRYADWSGEYTTGKYTPETVLLMTEEWTSNSVNIEGDVKLKQMTSKGLLSIAFKDKSSLTLEDLSGNTPLESVSLSVSGSGMENTLSIKGATGSNQYDLKTNNLQVSQMKELSTQPNAVYIGETVNTYDSSHLIFKVGDSLPAGVKDGVYIQNLNLHGGGELTVESTDLPDNAFYIKNDFNLYPGHVSVTGGGKNAIRIGGHNPQSNMASTIYAVTTAPDSTGIFYDSSFEHDFAAIAFNNTNIYAQGDAYGMKITIGSLSFSGSPDSENPIGESAFKGGIAAISMLSMPDVGLDLNYHLLNLVLTGNHPQALGALYFDSNNSSAAASIGEEGTINAVSESQSFQGAGIQIKDGFVPNEYTPAPIQLSGNGQIITTLPSHIKSPLWGINADAINMGAYSQTSITQNYTNLVSIGTSPTLPYNSSYDPTLFAWTTQPTSVDFNLDSTGFTAAESAQGTTLTGAAITLPPLIINQNNNLYTVHYTNVDFSNRGTITLDPTAGAVEDVCFDVVFGQPVGTLPNAVNPLKLFMGWYTEKEGQGLKITPEYIITNSSTFYAYWTTPVQQITYQPMLPELGPVEENIAMGELLSPPSMSPAGFTLEGWYTDSSFTTKWDFSKNFVPNNPVVLYAKWRKNTYTVTFNTGFSITNLELSFSDLIPRPENPVQEGKTFVGWVAELTENATLWNFETDTMPLKNLTLNAQWQDNNSPDPELEWPNPDPSTGGNTSPPCNGSSSGKDVVDKNNSIKAQKQSIVVSETAPIPEDSTSLPPALATPSSGSGTENSYYLDNPSTGGLIPWTEVKNDSKAIVALQQPLENEPSVNASPIDSPETTLNSNQPPSDNLSSGIKLQCVLFSLLLLFVIITLVVLWKNRKNSNSNR